MITETPRELPAQNAPGADAPVCSAETHAAIVADQARYHDLPLVGVQDLGDGEYCELRNCACGSTLGAPPRGFWLRLVRLHDLARDHGAPFVRDTCRLAMRGNEPARWDIERLLIDARRSGLAVAL